MPYNTYCISEVLLALNLFNTPGGQLCYPFVADKKIGQRGKYLPKVMDLEVLDEGLANPDPAKPDPACAMFL